MIQIAKLLTALTKISVAKKAIITVVRAIVKAHHIWLPPLIEKIKSRKKKKVLDK